MFNVWNNVLEELKTTVSDAQFSTYLCRTSLLKNEDGEIHVGVTNGFMQKNIPPQFNKQIKAALEHNNIKVKSIFYDIIPAAKVKKQPREVGVETRVQKVPQSQPKHNETNLSPDYTMDNFVVGGNNDLAVSVARNIIDRPGDKRFNPFFLYGGSGLGKTHLAQAIGNALHKKDPKLKILYIPINHFYSEFVDATQHRKMDAFKKKYSSLDVFIVDDFQFIVGKEKSQLEFFDIFNDMYQMNRQVIVTSDRLPSEIETVDERLASRLTGSGYYDIQAPNFEERCAILKSRAEYDGVDIENEAIEYIAEVVKTNVRDLEGDYERLIAMADLKGVSPLSIINSGYSQGNPVSTRNKNTTPKRILEKTAKAYGITVADILGGSRVSNIKTARQVCMFLLTEELRLSTTKIAREVGLKDHTSVMHGVKKIKEDLKHNFELKERVSEIRGKIYR